MALSHEDKKDVSRAFGKKAASAVSKATRDSINSRIELNRAASGGGAEGRVPHKYGSSKSKALKSKTGMRHPGQKYDMHSPDYVGETKITKGEIKKKWSDYTK